MNSPHSPHSPHRSLGWAMLGSDLTKGAKGARRKMVPVAASRKTVHRVGAMQPRHHSHPSGLWGPRWCIATFGPPRSGTPTRRWIRRQFQASATAEGRTVPSSENLVRAPRNVCLHLEFVEVDGHAHSPPSPLGNPGSANPRKPPTQALWAQDTSSV